MLIVDRVRLRPVLATDLPQIFLLQNDPESNNMAVTIPRTREAFDLHWAKALDDPAVTARAIIFDDAFVGMISRFTRNDRDHIGYWIDRAFWGKGIASRAVQLLLEEVTQRPLIATAATSNVRSIRILQKCGFVIDRIHQAPADERHPACEEAVLILE